MNDSSSFKRRRGPHSRKGSMVVLVAVSMIILLVAAAFSVDVAYMFLASEQLHIVTDATCKAAVTGLSQGNTEASAIKTAINCAAANKVCGQPVVLTESDIVLGGVTYSDGYWAFTPGTVIKTAAQVKTKMTVPLFFGCSLGTSSFLPTRTSTAAFLRNKWCFVFDRSGSMCYDMTNKDTYPKSTGKIPTGYYYPPHPTKSRWAYLVAAANTFLAAVATSPVQNQVGMTTFGTYASQDCTFNVNYAPINQKLTYYTEHQMIGNTNLRGGVQEAINMFASTDDGTPWNRVIIILSDGEWNTGGDPTSLIGTLNDQGIVVHAVGLLEGGANYAMQRLADRTGGQFLMANSGAELDEAFRVLALTIPVILTQ